MSFSAEFFAPAMRTEPAERLTTVHHETIHAADSRR